MCSMLLPPLSSRIADDDSLNGALSQAVHPLQNIPALHKDWHPSSDGLVLDLVHPSLFPLKYGKTKILPQGNVGLHDCGESMAVASCAQKSRKTQSTHA